MCTFADKSRCVRQKRSADLTRRLWRRRRRNPSHPTHKVWPPHRANADTTFHFGCMCVCLCVFRNCGIGYIKNVCLGRMSRLCPDPLTAAAAIVKLTRRGSARKDEEVDGGANRPDSDCCIYDWNARVHQLSGLYVWAAARITMWTWSCGARVVEKFSL